MKRILILVGITLFVFFVFYLNAKLHYSHDQVQNHVEKKEENIAADKNVTDDEGEKTLAQNRSKENSVKDFLTEKIQKAIKVLFQQEVHVVAIGDSLTQGVGDETENGGYVGVLEERLNNPENPIVTFTNLGKRGNRTDQLLQRLEDENIQAEMEAADII